MAKATLENKVPKILSTPEDFKEAGISEEELKKIGEHLRKFTILCQMMDKSFEDIFEVAPKTQIMQLG